MVFLDVINNFLDSFEPITGGIAINISLYPNFVFQDDLIKERIDNERKELQISIDKDRDNVTRRLGEEHDMRRIEQMEMQQRLDNNERAGKTDIQDIYG